MLKKFTEIVGAILIAIILAVVLWFALVDAYATEMGLQEAYIDEYVKITAPQLQRDVNEAELMGFLDQIEEPEQVEAVRSLGQFRVTHYCACSKCCGKWADGITATGTTAEEGRTIAVDPDVIPLGSQVRVTYADGTVAEYIAEDTGSAIHGNRLDVFIADHGRAWDLGVKYASVELMEE